MDPAAVRTPADFTALPVITKQNYVLRHPIADLCRGGRVEPCDMIAVSSGSTGKPTFWPRSITDELPVARRFEQVFHDGFRADTRRTLAVVCFALGSWVGGMYTAACCRHLAAKGYPITVVTPGNNKDEIFRVVQDLGPAFEQVVLLGYPPFLKDVIDTGRARGVDWAPFRIKLVMAGEVFSEEWRTLVGERVGSTSPCYDSASLYGTADAGVLGNETPLSVAIRRFLAGRPDAARALFGQDRLPTLVQYDPRERFFEQRDGMLALLGRQRRSARPLRDPRQRGRHFTRGHDGGPGRLRLRPAAGARRGARGPGSSRSSMCSGARISRCRTSGRTSIRRTWSWASSSPA